MSPVETETERIINEIQLLRNELKNAIEASEVRLQLRIEESKEKVRKLEEENAALKRKVEWMERRQNSANIIVFGLNKRREEISVEFISHKLESLLEINLPQQEIKDVHCLGSEENCPVKIEFISTFTKKHIFANCKKLAGTGVSIANDLTLQQRQELAVLRRHLGLQKQKGKTCFIRGNRLVIDKNEYTLKQLLDLEELRGNSAPTTPSEPIFREVSETEITKKSCGIAKVPTTPTSRLGRTTGTTGATKKHSPVIINHNISRVSTRSNIGKKK